MPRSAAQAANSSASAGDTVVMSTHVAQGLTGSWPPVTTSRTASEPNSAVMITSAPSTASSGVAAGRASAATRSLAAAGERFHTVRLCSALTCEARTRPIRPRPRKAIFMTAPFVDSRRQARRLCRTSRLAVRVLADTGPGDPLPYGVPGLGHSRGDAAVLLVSCSGTACAAGGVIHLRLRSGP
jgi:hypothetical protein